MATWPFRSFGAVMVTRRLPTFHVRVIAAASPDIDFSPLICERRRTIHRLDSVLCCPTLDSRKQAIFERDSCLPPTVLKNRRNVPFSRAVSLSRSKDTETVETVTAPLKRDNETVCETPIKKPQKPATFKVSRGETVGETAARQLLITTVIWRDS